MPRTLRSLARAAALLAFSAAVAVTAACTSGPADEGAASPSVTESVTASATPTSGPDPAVVAAVTDVMGRYIDAIVQMENSGQVDPAPLRDIAGPDIIDVEVKRVADMVQQGIHREGAPTLGEPVVTVNGDVARYEACMNQDDWIGVYGDQTVGSSYGSLPTGWDLTLSDNSWRVTALVPSEQVTITC